MKSIVSDYAVAVGSSILVNDTEIQVYQCGNGGMIALDGAFIQANEGEDLFINSPWDDGKSIQLVDSIEEVNKSFTCGEDNDPELIDLVINQLKEDFKNGDFTAIAEDLLHYIPDHILKNYLAI